MILPLTQRQARLLAREVDQIERLLGLLLGGGIGPADVTLVIVIDLRCPVLGEWLGSEVVGIDLVRHRLRSAVRDDVPVMTVPLSDEGGRQMLHMLAPQFVPASETRRLGEVPVLVIDDLGEMGFALIELDPRVPS